MTENIKTTRSESKVSILTEKTISLVDLNDQEDDNSRPKSVPPHLKKQAENGEIRRISNIKLGFGGKIEKETDSNSSTLFCCCLGGTKVQEIN
ncbi:unnamed protein product [Dimorphilus gyrociliatus]|uniref:Uncharacterized protein n=1 Tax=Dimorphilus gyrociliatus TaxID=2664684 RepID=A0A7I8V9I6_9ANNE|nr:unnamed protein product [Dimorphilus gyrociliatus]